MAQMVVFAPGHTTVCDLSGSAFWRVALGARGGGQNTPQLALIWRYPPGTDQHIVVLSAVDIPFTTEEEALTRVANACLLGGEVNADKHRTEEAFNLFKNTSRPPSADSLHAGIAAAYKLVEAYWGIRQWVESGMTEERTVEIDSVRIALRP